MRILSGKTASVAALLALSMAVLGLVMDRYSWVREHKLAVAQFWSTQIGTLLMLGGLPLVFLHLTDIPFTLGAMVPIGYVLFAASRVWRLRRRDCCDTGQIRNRILRAFSRRRTGSRTVQAIAATIRPGADVGHLRVRT